jgi:hypothetical protein
VQDASRRLKYGSRHNRGPLIVRRMSWSARYPSLLPPPADLARACCVCACAESEVSEIWGHALIWHRTPGMILRRWLSTPNIATYPPSLPFSSDIRQPCRFGTSHARSSLRPGVAQFSAQEATADPVPVPEVRSRIAQILAAGRGDACRTLRIPQSANSSSPVRPWPRNLRDNSLPASLPNAARSSKASSPSATSFN